MTTMEGAMSLFAAMLTVGFTLAGLLKAFTVSQTPVAARTAMAAGRPAQRTPPPVPTTEAHDYCAGCGNVVLRKAMRWTPEGTWRCRTCAPVDAAAELAAEIEAAGQALDPDSAARLIPIIASVPGRTFATLDEAKAAIRYMGGVGTIKMHSTGRWGHRTYEVIDTPTPFMGPGEYRDHNAKPVAYGSTADGEWSLWANRRQAELYAHQHEGKHCVVRPDARYWRVDVHPLDWRPEHDGQVGWMQPADTMNDLLFHVAQLDMTPTLDGFAERGDHHG